MESNHVYVLNHSLDRPVPFPRWTCPIPSTTYRVNGKRGAFSRQAIRIWACQPNNHRYSPEFSNAANCFPVPFSYHTRDIAKLSIITNWIMAPSHIACTQVSCRVNGRAQTPHNSWSKCACPIHSTSCQLNGPHLANGS